LSGGPDNKTILLASGGTGWHLFPALALAGELRQRGYDVHLATDHRTSRFDGNFNADNLHHVASDTVRSRSPLRMLRSAATLGWGFLSAWRLMGALKPALVVGFGGYPTLPTVWAASSRRVPICLHEQNGVLGRANKALAKHAKILAISLPEVKFVEGAIAAKARVTGNPVRPPVVAARKVPYRPPEQGQAFKLLVFGGSQGAKFFSDIMPDAIARLAPELLARLDIVQQCREEDCARVRDAYRAIGVANEVAAFFDDLPRRIADAHLVVSRSGASTTAELTVIGRPAIMVPLPHAIDNDQLANARALVAADAGWLMRQPEIDADSLAQKLEKCMTDPAALANVAKNARAIGRPNAAENLANLVVELVGDSGAMK